MTNDIVVTDRRQSGALRSMLVGVVFGVDAAGLCLALATICFGGALASGLGLATGLFLFGSSVATLCLFRYGGFRLALAISQDTSIAIIAPAVILAATSVAGSDQARVATGLAVIGTSTLASGLVFWAVGRLGLGRLVRMFPYPVVAGFLASSGFLLVYSAMAILTGTSTLAGMVAATGDAAVQLRLVPALISAIALFVAIKIWDGPSPVLIILFLSLIGYYAVAFFIELDQGEAIALGLLPQVGQSTGAGGILALPGLVDWSAVALATPSIAAVVLINLIGILLNTSGIELATGENIDENRELRVTGVANLLIGAVGGLTSYVQSGATIISDKLNVQRNPMILGHCVTLLVASVLAPKIVAVVPTFIPGALLMFIGLSMLHDWLVGTWRRLVLIDWLIVGCIVLATAILGILPAIAIGLVLATLGFAYAAIRLPVIRSATTSAQRRSIRDHSTAQSDLLALHGDRIRILHLQGPLFFGSVEQMTTSLRGFAEAGQDISALILDFTDVHSFDSSACAALEKLSHMMSQHAITAHVTGVSPRLRDVLERWGPLLDLTGDGTALPSFRLWPSLNDALEHCETTLLDQLQSGPETPDIARILFDLGHQNPRTADLIARMVRHALLPGDVLIAASEQVRDVFFVVSVRLGVHLPTRSGDRIRVRSIGHGAIVGEIAMLTRQPRNADVICEEAAVVMCLTEAEIRLIDAHDRDLMALMMAIFGRSLAAKLAQSNTQLANLQAR